MCVGGVEVRRGWCGGVKRNEVQWCVWDWRCGVWG